jgi:quinol monooxygenase YgiN
LALVPRDERDQDALYLWEEYTSETALREVHTKSKAAMGLKDTPGPLLEGREMAGFTEI